MELSTFTHNKSVWGTEYIKASFTKPLLNSNSIINRYRYFLRRSYANIP